MFSLKHSKKTVLIVTFFFLLSLSVFHASADDSLLAEIEKISEGTDLIASGYFEEGYNTLWLLFDNNAVVVLLRDTDLPDILSEENWGWLAYTQNGCSLTMLDDLDMSYSIDAPVNPCQHEYQKEIIAEATPESDGQELYTCIHCGKQYTVVTYYVEDDIKYKLISEVDGEMVEIEITKDSLDEILIIVGVDYSLVKLSKKYKPVTSIRISRILKLKPKARAQILLYAEQVVNSNLYGAEAENAPDDYPYEEEVCTFQAMEAGSASMDLDFENGETQTITFVAQENKSDSPEDSEEKHPITDNPVVNVIDGTTMTNGTILCGEAKFTVNDETITSVQIDGTEAEVKDGIYTIAGDGKVHKITVKNKYQESMTVEITVNSHRPGEVIQKNRIVDKATLTVSWEEEAYCTICGKLIYNAKKSIPYPGETESGDTPENPSSNENLKPPVDSSADETPAEAPAETEFISLDYNGASYRLNRFDKTASLVSLKNKESTVFTIPAAILYEGNDYIITSIDSKAFANMKKLKTVTIGRFVTAIGAKIFYHCPKLKTLRFKTQLLDRSLISKKAFSEIKNKKRLTVALPRKSFKSYKKLFAKCGMSAKVKYKSSK